MRLDKWLKVSRLIKRRTVAQEACDGGHVSVGGRVAKPSTDVKIGDVITVHLEITERNEEKKVLTIDCDCINQSGESVAKGVAEIIAPAEKITVDLPPVPKVTIS